MAAREEVDDVDILLRTECGEDAAAITVRGDGHPYTGVEWLQPVDERLTMTYRQGPRQWVGAREVGKATLLTPPGSVSVGVDRSPIPIMKSHTTAIPVDVREAIVRGTVESGRCDGAGPMDWRCVHGERRPNRAGSMTTAESASGARTR